MKKKVIRVLESIVVIALVFLYARIAKPHAIYDKTIDPSAYGTVTESKNAILEQEFEVNEDTLDGIRVKGAESGDISKVSLNYTLEEVDTNEVVAEGEINAKKALKSRFYELPFDTIENCNGKQYRLSLTQNAEDNESAVQFSFEKQEESNTAFYVDGEKIDGTMILKTLTDRFDLETFFVVMIFVIYIVAFMKLLYRLFK